MSWTQPLCTHCWVSENHTLNDDDSMDIRQPVRVLKEEWVDALVICCSCGRMTASGIWVRKDPTKVPYPWNEETKEIEKVEETK